MPSSTNSSTMKSSKDEDVEMAAFMEQKQHSESLNEVDDDLDDDPSLEKTRKPGSWSLRSSPATLKALSSCALYSFCSVSMILVNKSLASSYNHLMQNHDLNILLVVFQAITAVMCVETCKHTHIIESYPPITWKTARAWAPVNIFFCLMLFTGMASLQTNSVPMVTVFKNVANIVTSLGDYVFFGSKTESLCILAFTLMLGGAVMAAWNDITVTPVGLFWMAANCVSCSGYVLYMKYATNTIKMTKFGMVYVNNILCIVFLLPAAFAVGEIRLFQETTAIHTADYAFKNLFAGFVGFFLNFASLNCVQSTGPSTYAIVGSLNKIPVAILGYLLFDSIITPETWFFIAVSMCGGFLYSYAKLQTQQRKGGQREGCK